MWTVGGRRRGLLLLLVVTLALGGCSLTPAMSVQVDAIAAADGAAGKRYRLEPGDAATPADDLQFKEFAGYVDKALAGLGYRPAEADAPPDLIVALAYGVGEPQEKIYSYSIPEWGTWRARAPYPYSNIVTYRTEVDSYTTFARSVMLTAYAQRNGGRGDQVWRTIAVSRGSSEDLRRLFPMLLSAMVPYLGRDTGGQVIVTVREGDAAGLEAKASAVQRDQ